MSKNPPGRALYWNDPPPIQTRTETSSKSQHLKLNKRVGFPPTSAPKASPSTSIDGNSNKSKNQISVPAVADAGAKSTSDMPPPPPPRCEVIAEQDSGAPTPMGSSNDSPSIDISVEEIVLKLETSLNQIADTKKPAIKYGLV